MTDDDEVSEAVVTWSGYGETSWPARDAGRLVTRYGEHRAAIMFPQVEFLVDEFYRSDAYASETDLASVGRTAAARFRAIHPEVSDQAVEALAWCYTFDWK